MTLIINVLLTLFCIGAIITAMVTRIEDGHAGVLLTLTSVIAYLWLLVNGSHWWIDRKRK